MKRKYKTLFVIAPAVFILDQLTKLIIVLKLDIGDRIPVIPHFFDIVHFRNTGAAFGMFAKADADFRVPFFYIVAVAAAVILGFFYRSLGNRERLMSIAVSLVFGGIAGNILDRLRIGSVIDFLSFHIGNRVIEFTSFGRPLRIVLEWPAFNVADSAITFAMFMILYSALFRKGSQGAVL